MQMMRLLLSTPILLLSANASVVFGSDVRGTGLEKELHDKQQLARSLHLFDDPPEDVVDQEEEEEGIDPPFDIEDSRSESAEDEYDEEDFDALDEMEFRPQGKLRGRAYPEEDSYSEDEDELEEVESGPPSKLRGRGGGGSYGKGYGYYPHFKTYYNKGCRNSYGYKGYRNHDYYLYNHVSKSTCEYKCKNLGYDCYGYEYYSYSNKCEVWKVPINKYKLEYVHGLHCYIKDHY